LPTLAGWLAENDIGWNLKLGMVDEQQAQHWRNDRERERNGLRNALNQNSDNFNDHRSESEQMIDASVRYIGHTRAPLVLLPIEDAMGLAEQFNLPGNTESHPNWRRRLPAFSASLMDDETVARRVELLSQARLQASERDR
jgi:4-alpha-glucanotransferase